MIFKDLKNLPPMYTLSQETTRESAPHKKIEEANKEKGRLEIQEIEDLGD